MEFVKTNNSMMPTSVQNDSTGRLKADYLDPRHCSIYCNIGLKHSCRGPVDEQPAANEHAPNQYSTAICQVTFRFIPGFDQGDRRILTALIMSAASNVITAN